MEEFLLQVLLLILDILLLHLQELQLLLQFLPAQREQRVGCRPCRARVGGGGPYVMGNGRYAGANLGLNTPCSGCTGPPGLQVQVPERKGQSVAETRTVLGSHPIGGKENLVLEVENHLMKSVRAFFLFRHQVTYVSST